MGDPRQSDREYSLLMELFFHLVDSKAGQKVEDETAWLYDTEALAAKLFNHIGTIRHLQHGTELPAIDGRPRQYVDHSSISVLARAAFETFLCYYYIYGDAQASMEARKLRHDIWRLGGLLDRQKVSCISEKGAPVLEQDKRVIAQLLSNIESNRVFHAFNTEQQKKARRGEWRLDYKWADLAEIAGFDRNLFKDVYGYFCSYAHSGGLSLLQVSQAVSLRDQQYLTGLASDCAMILMSHFVISYTNLFPDTRVYLQTHAETMQVVRKWHVRCKARS